MSKRPLALHFPPSRPFCSLAACFLGVEGILWWSFQIAPIWLAALHLGLAFVFAVAAWRGTKTLQTASSNLADAAPDAPTRNRLAAEDISFNSATDPFGIILSSIGDAVIATDIEGRITLMNSTAERLTGWRLEDARGERLMTVFEIFNAETGESCENPVEKVLRTGNVVGLANHTTLRSRTGETFQIADSGSPIRAPGGALQGVVLVFSDVSQDYRLREAVRKSEERHRIAMESALEGIWDVDLISGERYHSPQMFRLIGATPDREDISQTEWYGSIHPEDLPRVRRAFEQLLSGAQAVADEEYRIGPNPQAYRWVRGKIQATRTGPDGKPERISGIVEDIHERKVASLERDEVANRLTDAQRAAAFGIVEVDYREGTVMLSEELVALHGRDKSRWTFEEAFPLMPDEDREYYLAAVEEAARTNGIVNVDYRIRNSRTGELHWVHQQARVTTDEDGNLDSLIGTAVDITERKRNEERLRKLNCVLESMREVHRILHREQDLGKMIGQITEVLKQSRGFHSAWGALSGREGEEFFGAAGFAEELEVIRAKVWDPRLPCDHFTPQPLEGVLTLSPGQASFGKSSPASDEADVAGSTWAVILTFAEKGHGYLAVTLPAELAEDPEERRLFRELGEDLSRTVYLRKVEMQRESIMQELIEAKDRAIAANHAKDEFLAVMSHEMRTPLNPIVGFANLLLEDSEDPETRECLETILDSSKRLLALIEDLLEYSRLSSDRPPDLKSEPVDLLSLCQSELEMVARRAPHLSFNLKYPAEGAAPLPAEANILSDDLALHRILDNLLSNACKFTPKGGVTLELGQIETETESGTTRPELRLAVRDTGIGIDPSQQQRLFEPFAQADSSYSRAYDGAGLGLAICRSLVHLLGGSIGVESTPGAGSCFWFQFPARWEFPQNTSGSENVVKSSFAELTGSHILVVDDNQANTSVYRAILRHAGATVSIAHSGEEALRLLAEIPAIDLVVMDLAMPGMDGIEAMKRIRSDLAGRANMPTIIVSAHAGERDECRCLEAGANDYLRKPVDARTFTSTICERLPR